MTHLDHLEHLLGKFTGKKILDVGAGKGGFLLDCARASYNATGIEINNEKIAFAHEEAKRLNLAIDIRSAVAEQMPFGDNEFDFINVCEVIEHVQDPIAVLAETCRVLRPGGKAYVSAHNRYGVYDTHFHVYFLGWMPRQIANTYLGMLGKHKDYAMSVDHQDITQMHYYTYGRFKKIASNLGFSVIDAREQKIKKRWGTAAALLYRMLRPLWFSTFHFILQK